MGEGCLGGGWLSKANEDQESLICHHKTFLHNSLDDSGWGGAAVFYQCNRVTHFEILECHVGSIMENGRGN